MATVTKNIVIKCQGEKKLKMRFNNVEVNENLQLCNNPTQQNVDTNAFIASSNKEVIASEPVKGKAYPQKTIIKTTEK